MKIFFVRHGESELNIENREQGPEGSLSALGKRQAVSLARRFKKIPLDLIVSSPHQRTRETAEAIRLEIGGDITYSDFLIERKPATELIGMRTDDPAYVKIRDLMNEKRLVDPSWKYADEDNFIDLKERALGALGFLSSLEHDAVVAVTHAGILRVIMAAIIFGPDLTYVEYLKIFRSLWSSNTGITFVEFVEASTSSKWRVITWNDLAHLEDV